MMQLHMNIFSVSLCQWIYVTKFILLLWTTKSTNNERYRAYILLVGIEPIDSIAITPQLGIAWFAIYIC